MSREATKTVFRKGTSAPKKILMSDTGKNNESIEEETIFECPRSIIQEANQFNQMAINQHFMENVDNKAHIKHLEMKFDSLTKLFNEKNRELSVYKSKKSKTVNDKNDFLKKSKELVEELEKKKSTLIDEMYNKKYKGAYDEWFKNISKE